MRLLYALAALLAVLGMAGRANAFCPVGCFCDDETLQVTCDEANLEVIPITLNPSVQVTINQTFHFISAFFLGLGWVGLEDFEVVKSDQIGATWATDWRPLGIPKTKVKAIISGLLSSRVRESNRMII
jgi:hypothetical protein